MIAKEFLRLSKRRRKEKKRLRRGDREEAMIANNNKISRRKIKNCNVREERKKSGQGIRETGKAEAVDTVEYSQVDLRIVKMKADAISNNSDAQLRKEKPLGDMDKWRKKSKGKGPLRYWAH